MTYMADECSYQASFGPGLEGSNYEGRDAVREGYVRFFTRYPDGTLQRQPCVCRRRSGRQRMDIHGDQTGRSAGDRARGCDLFEFVGEQIRRKDAFRKQRTTLSSRYTPR